MKFWASFNQNSIKIYINNYFKVEMKFLHFIGDKLNVL